MPVFRYILTIPDTDQTKTHFSILAFYFVKLTIMNRTPVSPVALRGPLSQILKAEDFKVVTPSPLTP